MGTPNREPEDYSRNIPIRILIFYYVRARFLGRVPCLFGLRVSFFELFRGSSRLSTHMKPSSQNFQAFSVAVPCGLWVQETKTCSFRM